MKKVMIVETENSWRFQDEEGKLLVETNLFGGVEIVEMMKRRNIIMWKFGKTSPSFESEVF